MAIKNLGKVVPQKGVDYFTDADIKSLNIPKKTSDLTNDSSYATETYVKNQIANAQLGGEGGEVDLSGYATKDDLHSHSNKDVLDSITQDDINKWNNNSGGSGLTTEQINALNEMFKVCAYVKEDVSTEYGAFKNAFGIDGGTVPTKTLQSITATYSGGNVAVGTNVNTLTGITVKANYSDGTSTSVTGYTLSGTIAEGSNIITVTYEGLTTTFAVTGVAEETGGEETTKTLQSISATYTGGNVTVGTSVNSLTGVTVKANYSDGSQENVTGYTLSGNIVEGNNTITVTYEGLTTTFIVVGIAESTGGEETNVSNETTWTDGVAYTFNWVENEYVKQTGQINTYNGWNRSPYLYCAGASRIDFTKPNSQQADYNAFYDVDKQYISSFSPNTTKSVDVPEGASYFVVSGPASVLTQFAATPIA